MSYDKTTYRLVNPSVIFKRKCHLPLHKGGFILSCHKKTRADFTPPSLDLFVVFVDFVQETRNRPYSPFDYILNLAKIRETPYIEKYIQTTVRPISVLLIELKIITAITQIMYKTKFEKYQISVDFGSTST